MPSAMVAAVPRGAVGDWSRYTTAPASRLQAWMSLKRGNVRGCTPLQPRAV